ncbi:MAG: hypothetical protein ACKVW3_09870 [Phycisphaerales bacterium]
MNRHTLKFMWTLIICLAHASAAKEPGAARALAQAVQLHDQSVRCLQWSQTVFHEVGTPRELTWPSTQSLDDSGRWRCDVLQRILPTADAKDNKEFIELRSTYALDGRTLFAFDFRGSGTIRSYQNECRIMLSADCWLGRHVDLSRLRTLSELLLDSPDLRIERTSERGLPILACSTQLGEMIVTLEVEVDTEHGFAPRSIWVRDRTIRIPYDHLEVVEFTRISGVWLPKRGRLVTRMFQPAPDEMKSLQGALAARSLPMRPQAYDATTMAAYHAALVEAFQKPEAPSAPMVPPLSITIEYTAVNESIDETTFQAKYPREHGFLDVRRNLVKRAGTDVWVVND